MIVKWCESYLDLSSLLQWTEKGIILTLLQWTEKGVMVNKLVIITESWSCSSLDVS